MTTLLRPANLFVPPDLDAAQEAWHLNCGPGSFAALLGKTGAETRQFFPGFEERRYTNPTQMSAALTLAGVAHRRGVERPGLRAALICIQFGGPWLKPGVPPRVAYRYTHWIAMREAWVFDVNQDDWYPIREWENKQTGTAVCIADTIPRCDGTFAMKTSLILADGYRTQPHPLA